MKKALIGILVSVMMLVTVIPLTAVATIFRQESDPTTSEIFGHTTIRGFAIYLGRSAMGRTTHIFALRLHFSTITPSGENSIGIIRMRPIDIPTQVIGYHGHFYIFASFRGTLNV